MILGHVFLPPHIWFINTLWKCFQLEKHMVILKETKKEYSTLSVHFYLPYGFLFKKRCSLPLAGYLKQSKQVAS